MIYIKSEDTFIEIQGYWAHGPHPFDSNNKEDINLINQWRKKANKNNIYERAIDYWTHIDVITRKVAKENNLKFIEIFDRELNKEKLINILKEYGIQTN